MIHFAIIYLTKAEREKENSIKERQLKLPMKKPKR
jgi:hypothetical protein